MPISVESAISGPFFPNGVTTSFAFTFKADSASEVFVIDNEGSRLSSGLYSVSLNSGEGGTATFSVAPLLADYAELYIINVPAFTQTADFGNSGPSFNPASLTRAFDKAAMRDIWLKDRLDLLISDEMMVDADSAGKFLALDAEGRPIYSSGTGADAGLRTDLAAPTGVSLIGYGPRTVNEKLADDFCVLDIAGVTGDAGDDPSVLPIGLIAARDAGERSAWFPIGTYPIDSTLDVWPMVLRGPGLGGAATIIATETMDEMVYTGGQNGRIDGIALDGAGLADVGISLYNSTLGIVKNCLIQNCRLDAIQFSTTSNNNGTTIRRNLIRDCGTLTAGTCSTSGSTVTWTGADLTALDPPIRLKYDMVRIGAGGTAYSNYTITAFTATTITVSEAIGTNAAGTTCAILQGNGVMITPQGDNNVIVVDRNNIQDIVGCGLRDLSLYGARGDNFYSACEVGRAIGVSGVHQPIGATEHGYFEGNRSVSIHIEQATGATIHPRQLPAAIQIDVLTRDATRVNGSDFQYLSVRFASDVTMLQNSTSAVDLAFGGTYVVHQNAAVGGRTLNLPPMTAGTNPRRIAGTMRGEIVIFMEVLNGQTITLDAPESDVNGSATKTNSTDYVRWVAQYCDTLGKWLVS